ncbi:MAG: DUF6440 family protein [Oscillospiraceae bacterium]
MSKKENNRFQIIFEETNSIASGSKVLKDKETDVLYFFHYSGYAGGLTPLLDKDGKPLVDSSNPTE